MRSDWIQNLFPARYATDFGKASSSDFGGQTDVSKFLNLDLR